MTTKTSTAKATETKKATTNGQAQKKPLAPLKVEKSTTQLNDILNPSAGARIKKLANLNKLASKHDFLQGKKDELETFIISSDGTKETINLSNQEGMQYVISNTQVVEKVVALLQSELDVFIKASEEEILSYSI